MIDDTICHITHYDYFKCVDRMSPAAYTFDINHFSIAVFRTAACPNCFQTITNLTVICFSDILLETYNRYNNYISVVLFARAHLPYVVEAHRRGRAFPSRRAAFAAHVFDIKFRAITLYLKVEGSFCVYIYIILARRRSQCSANRATRHCHTRGVCGRARASLCAKVNVIVCRWSQKPGAAGVRSLRVSLSCANNHRRVCRWILYHHTLCQRTV